MTRVDSSAALPKFKTEVLCSSSAIQCLVACLVPGSPPFNVRARPVSSSTVVVQWEEPKVPNGLIKVQYYELNDFVRIIT